MQAIKISDGRKRPTIRRSRLQVHSVPYLSIITTSTILDRYGEIGILFIAILPFNGRSTAGIRRPRTTIGVHIGSGTIRSRVRHRYYTLSLPEAATGVHIRNGTVNSDAPYTDAIHSLGITFRTNGQIRTGQRSADESLPDIAWGMAPLAPSTISPNCTPDSTIHDFPKYQRVKL